MWILLPESWTGKDAVRYAEATSGMADLGSAVLSTFAAAMALMEDWSVPGLMGNPEKWDFEKVDLPIIAWVNFHVVTNLAYGFMGCFEVPLNSFAPSPSGRAELETGNQSYGKTAAKA